LHNCVNQLDEIYKSLITNKQVYTFQSIAIQYYEYIYDLENGSQFYKKSNLTKDDIISKAKLEYSKWIFIENNLRDQINNECENILARLIFIKSN
jgi:hypothetical protein